ncbi:MAG: peptide chain release factor 2 [Myxococcota bacterium]|nr:peptide chain release factor 2 [Myxococcota bacterium]
MSRQHEELVERRQVLGRYLDEAHCRERVGELDHLSAAPGFWDDQARAQELLKERNTLKARLDQLGELQELLDTIELMVELAEEDPSGLAEAGEAAKHAEVFIAKMEFERMLSGPHDQAACFVSVNAGAGGTESQDWAEILLRMLLRFCERRGYKVDVTDRLDGEEAGIKSTTLRVEGDFAFGYLKAENGVHRLVRISPFDSQKRRHTSFASVSVLPDIEEDIDIEVREEDIKMDVFRASGAGGQHVNRTNSAVRLTHEPSGIVVACQAERSQHKNRATAMKMLKSRLYEVELSKRTEERDALYANKARVDFGSQIRSYVLHPYQMVKDLRSGHESSDTQGVLDGDLEPFMEAYLLIGAEGGED